MSAARVPRVVDDPEQLRREVEDVLARPEYDYGPSWWERAVDWLAERLEDLLGPLLPGAGTFGGGASSLVAWLIIVVAAGLVVLVVVRAVRSRTRRSRDDATPFEVEVDRTAPAGHWRDEAELLESEGRWRDALRARVRQLVRTLADDGAVTDRVGRTTRELLEEVGRARPDTRPAVAEVFERFESVWYGGEPHDADEHRRVVAAVATAVSSLRGPATVDDTTSETVRT